MAWQLRSMIIHEVYWFLVVLYKCSFDITFYLHGVGVLWGILWGYGVWHLRYGSVSGSMVWTVGSLNGQIYDGLYSGEHCNCVFGFKCFSYDNFIIAFIKSRSYICHMYLWDEIQCYDVAADPNNTIFKYTMSIMRMNVYVHERWLIVNTLANTDT